MTQVTYPGVYLQEKSSGVRTITGVATSVTSFIGRAVKGQMNKPVRCFSYGDFVRSFGSPHSKSDLAPSVKQFFDNGGTDCFIVRIAAGPSKASLVLQNYAGVNTLTATAKSEGAWGAGLRLEVDYNTPTPDETFTLRVLQEDNGQIVANESHANLSLDSASSRYAPTLVTQNSDLITLELHADAAPATSPAGFSQSRRIFKDDEALGKYIDPLVKAAPGLRQNAFDISVNGSPFKTVDLTGWASPGNGALAELKTKINAALLGIPGGPQVNVTLAAPGYLTITATGPGPNSTVRVRRSSASDIAAGLMLGVDQGGIEPARWSNLRPKATGTLLVLDTALLGTAQIDAVSAQLQSAFVSLNIDGTVINTPLATTAGADAWSKNKLGDSTATGDSDGVREKLRIIANAINANVLLKYRAEAFGYHLAILAKEGDVAKKPAITAIPGFTTALVLNSRRYALLGGDDGTAPGITEYVGDQNAQTGFYALDPVDLFNLAVIPRDFEVSDSQMEDIYGQASIYCQSRRAFLLMDPPKNWTSNTGMAAVVQDPSKVNTVRAKVIKDYSAVFYPPLTFNDRGLQRVIGPSGAMAGLFSRTDASRGVWKAPAGTEADLRGITGFQVKLTDRENGVLNKQGVNCLRNFPSGFVSWGARTMDGLDDIGSEWKYIPIRRLALFIEESLYRGTQWAVFEPNDEPLWANLRLNIGAFLNGLFRQGAFQGATPTEAFYVKCDKETTTQNDRNLGIVNVEIGFAPLKPAEFVVITIQQMAGDLK